MNVLRSYDLPMLRVIAVFTVLGLASPWTTQPVFAQSTSSSYSPATQQYANSLLHLSPEEREQGRRVRDAADHTNDGGDQPRKRHRGGGGMPGMGQ